MRVLMLTRMIDHDHWRWGFVHQWVSTLAQHVTHLHILCQEQGTTDLPSNVEISSMGMEQGAGRWQLLLNMQRVMADYIHNVDVIFGHMVPRYTLLAAPWAKLFRVPMVKWYTFGHIGMEVRLAHAVVDRVVTASQDSFPFPSQKVIVTGHGIDFDRFKPRLKPLTPHRTVISVGRLDPQKKIEELIDVAHRLYQRSDFDDVRFLVAGGETPQTPPTYRHTLEARIADYGMMGRFQLVGAVPAPQILSFYQSADVMLSVSRTGSLDKVILEAIGCGLPVLVTGTVYADILGQHRSQLLTPEGDVKQMVDHLADLLSCPDEERRALGLSLRERVVTEHSLDQLMKKLVSVFHEVAG